MKKFIRLMSISALTTISGMQVVACTDDSKYKDFISEVNNSAASKTAFFGFLGSADDDTSVGLNDGFTYIQSKTNGSSTSIFDKWKNDHTNEMKGAGVTNISLQTYQGPYHQDKPSDPISSFWYDKNISWQRDIFSWVYNKANFTSNSDYRTPNGVPDVKEIVTKKDSSSDKKDMFTVLPIVFCIVDGKLYTAGQNWIKKGDNPNVQVNAIENFILANILTPRT